MTIKTNELNAAIKKMWMHYTARQVEALIPLIRRLRADGEGEHDVIQSLAEDGWFHLDNPDQREAVKDYVRELYAC